MDILFQIFNNIYPMPPEVETFFKNNLKAISCKKGTYLLRQGEVCKKGYYIIRGIVYAAYFLDGKSESLKSVCNWIYPTNNIVISVESFFHQQAAKENLVCLTDTELLYIDENVLQEGYQKYLGVNYILRVCIQNYYVENEKRLYDLRNRSAEERYEIFKEKYASILNEIPDHLIASYIGINKASFSRIKKIF